jgi:hypothetical protein
VKSSFKLYRCLRWCFAEPTHVILEQYIVHDVNPCRLQVYLTMLETASNIIVPDQ